MDNAQNCDSYINILQGYFHQTSRKECWKSQQEKFTKFLDIYEAYIVFCGMAFCLHY
jgi:hypothetical protein